MAVAGVCVSRIREAVLPTTYHVKSYAGNSQMIDWIPVGFVIFKVLTLSTCMYFAVKWHYDQGKNGADRRTLLLASGKVVAIFMVLVLVLGFGAFSLARMLGLDLSMP